MGGGSKGLWEEEEAWGKEQRGNGRSTWLLPSPELFSLFSEEGEASLSPVCGFLELFSLPVSAGVAGGFSFLANEKQTLGLFAGETGVGLEGSGSSKLAR